MSPPAELTMIEKVEAKNTYYSLVSGDGVSAIGTFILFGEHFKEVINKIFIPKNPLKKKECDNYEKINFGLLKFNDIVYDEVILIMHQESQNFPYIAHCEINTHGSIGIIKAVKQLFMSLGIKEITRTGILLYLLKNKKLNYIEKEIYFELFKTISAKYTELLENEKKKSFLEVIKEVINDKAKVREIAEELLHKYTIISKFKKPIKVGIFGAPNSGKSTLFNRLTATQRAIVSPQSGTTRDYLVHAVNFRDFTIEFIDTAGIFESDDFINTKAREITKKLWNKRDITKIVVFSYDVPLPAELSYAIKQQAMEKQPILVYNKIDVESFSHSTSEFYDPVQISALKNIGIDLLIEEIKKKIGVADFQNLTNPIIFTKRQYILINRILRLLNNNGNSKLKLLINEIENGRKRQFLDKRY